MKTKKLDTTTEINVESRVGRNIENADLQDDKMCLSVVPLVVYAYSQCRKLNFMTFVSVTYGIEFLNCGIGKLSTLKKRIYSK